MNADPNEQLMRIPVVRILSFSLRNGHGVVVGLVRLLLVVLYQVILIIHWDPHSQFWGMHFNNFLGSALTVSWRDVAMAVANNFTKW